jgi:hypothetical protein
VTDCGSVSFEWLPLFGTSLDSVGVSCAHDVAEVDRLAEAFEELHSVLVARGRSDGETVEEPDGTSTGESVIDVRERARDGGAPEVVWVGGGDAQVSVSASIFAPERLATELATASGLRPIEVVIDNRDGRHAVPVGVLRLESEFSDDGEFEVFPLVADFADACDAVVSGELDAATTAALGEAVDCGDGVVDIGEIARFVLVGSWPETEPVVTVSWDAGDGRSTVRLTAASAAEVAVPAPDQPLPGGETDGVVEGSADVEGLAAYADAVELVYLAGAPIEERVAQLEANCTDPGRLATVVDNVASRPALVPEVLAQHSYVCPDLVSSLGVSLQGRSTRFVEDLVGLRAQVSVSNPRVAGEERFDRFVARLRENCTVPGQLTAVVDDGGEPLGSIVAWHAFICPETVMALDVGAPAEPERGTDPGLVTPAVVFAGREAYETPAGRFVRHDLQVVNWDAYDPDLFAPAPHLPPCGRNDDAARTWIDIVDAADGTHLYGFCAIDTPEGLLDLWFSIPRGDTPPAEIAVVLTDRETGTTVTSDPVAIPPA